jgi:hypothetical protein
MNGSESLETIAKEVVIRFERRFRDWRDALTRVGELAQKYGENA